MRASHADAPIAPAFSMVLPVIGKSKPLTWWPVSAVRALAAGTTLLPGSLARVASNRMIDRRGLGIKPDLGRSRKAAEIVEAGCAAG